MFGGKELPKPTHFLPNTIWIDRVSSTRTQLCTGKGLNKF